MRGSRIVQDKLSSVEVRATKRLQRDLREIMENPLAGVAALPLENNLFKWHANLAGPKDTPWESGIFHFELNFPRDYPDNPPSLTVCTRIPHPNVFDTRVCLDMLETGVSAKGSGWSSAYSVLTIMVQLQAFLFESNEDTVTKDLRDPTEYKKAKEKWHSSVEWAVKQSVTYQDTTVKHHPPRSPWPPLPEVSGSSETDYKSLLEKELVCFYTKQPYTEDCLGVGLTFNKNLRTGEIKEITAFPDFLSLRAFMNHRVRLSASNDRFTHWLPLFINEKHGEKALHLAKRSLSMICTGSTRGFQPEQAFHVLPKLMSSMVVQIMNGKQAMSVRALRGYCMFHRLFLLFIKEFPELKERANKAVEAFIKDVSLRHKDNTPNLGELLAILGVSDYSWEDVRDGYMEESACRNVLWILSKFPELEAETHKHITDDDRLKYSFEVSRVGSHLLLFHIFFLKNVAQSSGLSKEDLAAKYDEYFGYPSPAIEEMYLQAAHKIEKIEDYASFYQAAGKPIGKSEIVAILKNAIVRSKERGYHGSGPALPTPEEFSADKQVDLDSLVVDGKLTEDEKVWKEMCFKEWGFETVPAYLADVSEPWKRLFLQNHLQDCIEKLNDVPDFKRFYNILEHSKDWIVQLQIDTFSPDNIKSRYHFLTAILSKLGNLATLIINKGDAALGEKGFKALAKGMASNTGSLQVLNLEYCEIDAKAIKQLTQGNLVSANLKKLLLGGNYFGLEGVRRLSEFLVQHNTLPHLEELDLSDCQIQADAATVLSESLLVKRNIQVLRLSKNKLGNGMGEILKNLAYSPSIRVIDMSKTIGTVGTSLEKLLSLTVSLEVLDFSRSPSLGLGKGFYEALSKNKTLRVLKLSETNHSAGMGKDIGNALAKNTTLKEFYLNGNQLTGQSLLDMWTVIKEANKKVSLEILDLSCNPLHMISKDKHARSLGDLLLLCPELQELNLAKCQMGKLWADSLATALAPEHGLKLRKLNFRENSLSKYGFKPLIDSLSRNKVLEDLDMSGNDLGVLGAKFVASVIEKNTSIRRLSLYGNLVEIEGAISIAQALEKNTTLEELDMGINRIRVRGAQAFADILNNGKCSLKHLMLKSNHINDKVAVSLVNGVINVETCPLTHLALGGNNLSDTIRAELASKLSRASRHITFDLAKLAEVKDPERQERTIYISPLPENITEQAIKKLFYGNQCGVCVSVDIKKHKIRKDFNSACYAFVTFAHPDSIKLATALVPNGKARIANTAVKIVRAGVENKAPVVKPKGGRRGPAARAAPRAAPAARAAPARAPRW